MAFFRLANVSVEFLGRVELGGFFDEGRLGVIFEEDRSPLIVLAKVIVGDRQWLHKRSRFDATPSVNTKQ